jgi:hypothetical protein
MTLFVTLYNAADRKGFFEGRKMKNEVFAILI